MEEVRRLAVVGSRKITDKELIFSLISKYCSPATTTIVSGGARGVDTVAANYATEKKLHLYEVFPEYDLYGRIAPIIRNKKIVQGCDGLIAIWDGTSRGTDMTINFARKQGKLLQVFEVPPDE